MRNAAAYTTSQEEFQLYSKKVGANTFESSPMCAFDRSRAPSSRCCTCARTALGAKDLSILGCYGGARIVTPAQH